MRFIKHTYTELDWIWLLFGRRNFIHFFLVRFYCTYKNKVVGFNVRTNSHGFANQKSPFNGALTMICCVWFVYGPPQKPEFINRRNWPTKNKWLEFCSLPKLRWFIALSSRPTFFASAKCDFNSKSKATRLQTAKLFLVVSKIDSDSMRVCKTRRVFVMKSHLFLCIQLYYSNISNIIMFWSSVGCKHKTLWERERELFTPLHTDSATIWQYGERERVREGANDWEKAIERVNERTDARTEIVLCMEKERENWMLLETTTKMLDSTVFKIV